MGIGGTGSSSLCTLHHLIPTITLGVRNYSPHFTDETKRGEVTGPISPQDQEVF